MAHTMNCDGCDAVITYDTRISVRLQRPSDKSDMCCIMWGCASCFPPQKLEELRDDQRPSQMTERDWDTWIESEAAMRQGFCFLT